jgi:hypothetical protein
LKTATKGKNPEPSEHQIQSAFVDWCALNGVPVFAIPNGGFRHIATARKLQREGVKPGVPDLFIPVVKMPYGGLFIEMKTPEGKVSVHQKEWISMLKEQYAVSVCRSLDDAIGVIRKYLGAIQ